MVKILFHGLATCINKCLQSCVAHIELGSAIGLCGKTTNFFFVGFNGKPVMRAGHGVYKAPDTSDGFKTLYVIE